MKKISTILLIIGIIIALQSAGAFEHSYIGFGTATVRVAVGLIMFAVGFRGLERSNYNG